MFDSPSLTASSSFLHLRSQETCPHSSRPRACSLHVRTLGDSLLFPTCEKIWMKKRLSVVGSFACLRTSRSRWSSFDASVAQGDTRSPSNYIRRFSRDFQELVTSRIDSEGFAGYTGRSRSEGDAMFFKQSTNVRLGHLAAN